jgi:hypothetical protein
VKNDYGTEYETWALSGLEEPLKKRVPYHVYKSPSLDAVRSQMNQVQVSSLAGWQAK